MSTLIRKLQAGLLIPIYVLEKVLQCLDTSPKCGCLEDGSTSEACFEGSSSKHVPYKKPAEAEPITEEDRRIIMEHVHELFGIGEPITEEDQRIIMQHVHELFGIGEPITEEDQRLIMQHVHELFGIGEPITEEDQRIIMQHVHELFGIDQEQSGKKPA